MPEKYQSFEGKMKVLAKEDDFLYRVKVYLLNSIVNRNNGQYLNLEQHKDLFLDTPLLVAYVNNGKKVGDGHNFRMKKDKNGEEYASFTDSTSERIVGWIRNKEDIRIETVDGVDWIVAIAYVWGWYAKELTDMLSSQGEEGMEVSIETLIKEMHMNGNTEVYDKYNILGTTILGKGVTPAVAGACIRACSLREGLEELKIRVASYEEEKKQKIKKASRCQMNKRQLAEIQAKFPDHRVLAASEDGKRIALLSKECVACSYEFAEGETTVAPERIKACNASISFVTDEAAEPIMIAVNEFADTLISENEELTEKLNQAEQARTDAETALNAMVEAENKRRVQAVKDALKAKLQQFNEGVEADERADNSVLDPINARVDAGEFTSCTDAEGKWNGEDRACQELMAKCAEKMLSAKAEKAKRENASRVYTWEQIKKNSTGSGIDGLLSRVNRE